MTRWRSWLLPRLARASAAGVTAGVAAVVFVGGAIVDPRRAAWAYLAAYATVLGVVLAMLLLLLTVELSGGAWFAPFRRRAETVIGTLPLLAVLFVPVVLGARVLYAWTTPDALPAPMRAAVDAKQPYLAPGFALARAALYWTVWIALGEAVRSASLRRDASSDEQSGRRMRALSVAGIPLLALTFTFASLDWLMSLDADWSSAAYGVYVYAGGTVGALALLALGGVLPGGDEEVMEATNRNDLQALAKLLLSFVLFWAYLGYVQFLIVWIADLPRETGWYAARSRGPWGALALALGVGHLVLPFVALALSAVRRSAPAMAVVGAWMLLMHWLDVYWLVVPARDGGGRTAPHWMDPAALVLVAGVAAAAGAWRDAGRRGVPARERAPRVVPDAARTGVADR